MSRPTIVRECKKKKLKKNPLKLTFILTTEIAHQCLLFGVGVETFCQNYPLDVSGKCRASNTIMYYTTFKTIFEPLSLSTIRTETLALSSTPCVIQHSGPSLEAFTWPIILLPTTPLRARHTCYVLHNDDHAVLSLRRQQLLTVYLR